MEHEGRLSHPLFHPGEHTLLYAGSPPADPGVFSMSFTVIFQSPLGKNRLHAANGERDEEVWNSACFSRQNSQGKDETP